jgi:hypothetical protein
VADKQDKPDGTARFPVAVISSDKG